MNRLKRLYHQQWFRLGVLTALAIVVGFVAVPWLAGTSKKSLQAVACDQHVTCVSLNGDQATPDVVTVAVGDYVQFNSADNGSHDVGIGEGGEHHESSKEGHDADGPSSGDFKGDEAWKVQMKDEGTFHFHDHYHPNAQITVVVYKPGGDYTIH